MKKILFLLFAFVMIAFTQASTITGVVSNDPTCIVQPAADVVAIDVMATDFTLFNYISDATQPNYISYSISTLTDTATNIIYQCNSIQPIDGEGVITFKLPPVPQRPALSHETIQKNFKQPKNCSVGFDYRT